MVSRASKIYQNTVAEACGLEVGERILQFQPAAPERQNSTTSAMSNSSSTISNSVVQSRLKKLPTCPQKVLDAPGFVDDFYLNLISWSSANVLAIALSNCVYCWNADTGDVDQFTECRTVICSVRWSQDGFYLSIGLEDGSIEIWDLETRQRLRTMQGHDSRVAVTCWNNHILSSGARSGQIFHHDVRIQDHKMAELCGHTAEVCGLEWGSDGLQLASGGNDNVVNIWDARSTTPQFTKTAHNAAVKALAWCPSHSSLLATGGGSACCKIHFWNTVTGARVNTIDTESQVSSLSWGYSSGVGMEIAATHGFPNNDISVYAYPSKQKTGIVIDAHESRVLGSCLSPDGTTLATVAADENLKFWKIFDYVERRDEGLSGKEMNKVIR
ncbi:DEKNAAC103311 [Brettanomyces naardenensis]|uniref:DEKNAAC103311 n=1 Tax=Brettanomyces naardenensis TaxID=13370 RepID=A0A448YNC1_BRENA|nr:DEKNAAC103311 [Brettanomyces naardenensis]